jgi:ATP-dependent DNA helicase RecG
MTMAERMAMDRVAATSFLEEPVTAARFVNAARARLLAKLGIATVGDLLRTYPRRYLDMSTVTTVAAASIGDTVTVVGMLDQVSLKRPKPRVQLVEAALVDETGVMTAVWFSQPWMAQKLIRGMRVALSGKIAFSYGYKQMSSPFVDVLSTPGEEDSNRTSSVASDSTSSAGVIIPIHSGTEGLSANWMRRLIASALVDAGGVLDCLPQGLRKRHGLMSYGAALREIHFPRSMEERYQARRRLAYQEILELQLHLMLRRRASEKGVVPTAHHIDGPHLAALRAALPFTLTGEQDQALEAILAEMAEPRCMQHLLLGDVGTGKTAVAAHALAVAVDSGGQAAMMAPTGVLAAQYGAKVGPLLDKAGIPWALLTGSTPRVQRADILVRLVSGELGVLFGTHALLEPDVIFKHLTLVVIDEQHRFGVGQRSSLLAKGPGADMLAMTATPIPRSLALMLYGDLTCTTLRTRPRAGAHVLTKLLTKRDTDRAKAYDAVRSAVEQGHQAYIICPLVGVPEKRRQASYDDSPGDAHYVLDDIDSGIDISDAKAAQQQAAFLARDVFPHQRVALLTGRMRPSEKDEVMGSFAAGDVDILVSTTVVEVGMDVPNATVMVVEDAELFGLSQLHQLRGRVGRGDHDGTVFLLASAKTDEGKERLEALASTEDGFLLAERDLATRREGDILGVRQHGAALLKLVDVSSDAGLIEAAHHDALSLIDADPYLSTPCLGPLAHEVFVAFSKFSGEIVEGG